MWEGGRLKGGGRGEDGGGQWDVWLCEISPQRHVREQAGNQNTNPSKNLENVDKRAVKQVQKLLEVGRCQNF